MISIFFCLCKDDNLDVIIYLLVYLVLTQIFQWKTGTISSYKIVWTSSSLTLKRTMVLWILSWFRNLKKKKSIRKDNFIKLLTTFLQGKVIMSVMKKRGTVCSALLSSHYIPIKGNHISEVIEYVLYCCKLEFSLPSLSYTLFSLHCITKNTNSSL